MFVIKARVNQAVIACADDEQDGIQPFEGNWYFAPENVDMAHLHVSDRTYTCPYKGVCFWIDMEDEDGRVARNVAWIYYNPKPGYEFIKDQIGFYSRSTGGILAEHN
ncbi:MAG: DUF427 domain-containing protein [Anaerolineae bacterium]|nr:DUF427 domain-containing protein [Anaerolineae bacterium]